MASTSMVLYRQRALAIESRSRDLESVDLHCEQALEAIGAAIKLMMGLDLVAAAMSETLWECSREARKYIHGTEEV